MSDMYGPADRPESIATIHAALDRGVTLLDTRALIVRLSPEQMARIEQAVPADAAAGSRYPQAQLAHMDSERPSS